MWTEAKTVLPPQYRGHADEDKATRICSLAPIGEMWAVRKSSGIDPRYRYLYVLVVSLVWALV
jgi:hypothetical protein